MYRKKDGSATRLYYCVSGHYPSSCFYLFRTTSRRPDSVCFQVDPTEAYPINRASPYPRTPEPTQDEMYVDQTQHKPLARIKTNMKNFKKFHTHEA
jgi:hypothetical protein